MADTTANLRSYCDNVEGIFWETEFDQGSSEAGYYVLKVGKPFFDGGSESG